MKPERLCEAMSLIDEKYIEEASKPYRPGSVIDFKKYAAIAACLVLSVVAVFTAMKITGLMSPKFDAELNPGTTNDGYTESFPNAPDDNEEVGGVTLPDGETAVTVKGNTLRVAASHGKDIGVLVVYRDSVLVYNADDGVIESLGLSGQERIRAEVIDEESVDGHSLVILIESGYSKIYVTLEGVVYEVRL